MSHAPARYRSRYCSEWTGGLLKPLAVFEDVFDEGARRRRLEAAEGDDGDGAREAVARDAQPREAAGLDLLAHGPRRHDRDPEAVLDHELDEVGVVRFEREVGTEVNALEEGVGRAADGGALLEEDEALAAHLDDARLAFFGELVARADDDA